MSDITTEIAVLKNEMKNIAEKVDEGFSNNSAEHKELVTMFQKAIDKKAGKWVEKVLIWVGATIGVILVGALMSVIIIQ